MKRADLARLLATAADYRRGYEIHDARTAAIVLLSTSAAIGPVAALRWSVADVVRVVEPTANEPNNGQWQILASVPVKGLAHVLPIDCRAALLVYLRYAIWTGSITSLDCPRMFPLSLRAVQIDVRALIKRAGLESKRITFHALKPAPTRPQARERKPPRIAQADDRGTPAPTGTEPTTAHPLEVRTTDDRARSPRDTQVPG